MNRKIKKISFFLLALLLFFAIVGIITTILFIIGFRPVKENNVKPNWEAVSSIATIFAVIAALFITQWQDWLSNKKELKIEWEHFEIGKYTRISFFGFPGDRRVDEIVVKFINTGNRKIILVSAYLQFRTKIENHFIPEFIAPKGQIPTMTFPCEIDIENCRQFSFPCSVFISGINTFIKDNQIKEMDVLIIEAKDTTGKKYKYNTKLDYQSYLKLANQQAGHQ